MKFQCKRCGALAQGDQQVITLGKGTITPFTCRLQDPSVKKGGAFYATALKDR
ncbi:MAG: hypothetical protein ACYCY0_12225 [Acidithiobacillus ferrivorans]